MPGIVFTVILHHDGSYLLVNIGHVDVLVVQTHIDLLTLTVDVNICIGRHTETDIHEGF